MSAVAVSLPLLCLLAVCAALVAGTSLPRRLVAGLIVCASLAVPFSVGPGWPLVTFFSGLFGVLITLRSLDLCRMARPLPPARRIWHMLAVYDTRWAKARPPGVEGGALLRVLGWAALASALLWVGLVVAPGLAAPWGRALQWGSCAFFAVATLEVVAGTARVGWGAVGISPPPIHEAPYLSRSISEFWTARWNKVVGTWLRHNLHVPLARRGWPKAGVAAAFAVSAAIHAYLVLPSLGWRPAAWMGGFFVAQILLVWAERALGVRSWRAAPARAWTLGALLLVSPLFCEPLLQLLRPQEPPAAPATTTATATRGSAAPRW